MNHHNNKIKELPFFTMLLLISFASVNAVLFTPALPAIRDYFSISENLAQQTITWFLVGYAIGQLLYGPIANRYGRKVALYYGIVIQIISSIICVIAGVLHLYWLLVLGRFFLALGSGVGLKMTFTLVNETYEPKIASQKLSYLMLAFAITPGLSVAFGGLLITNFEWTSCFYVGALYGFILLLLTKRLPETITKVDENALLPSHLWHGYSSQFTNKTLVLGGILMGGASSFIYVFASISPFIAMQIFGMSSFSYGLSSLLPSIGLVLGSLTSAQLIKHYSLMLMIKIGMVIISLGGVILYILICMNLHPVLSIFVPMIVIYFGLCFIFSNASVISLSKTTDKAHGAAVMSFINIGFATSVVLITEAFVVSNLLLPQVYLLISIVMLGIFMSLNKKKS